MSKFKMSYQNEILSPLLRRIVVGLTGLQKRLFFVSSQKIRGGGESRLHLCIALAGLFLSLITLENAVAQQSCTSPTVISDERTRAVNSSKHGECIRVTSTGSVKPGSGSSFSVRHNNVSVTIDGLVRATGAGGSGVVINRGVTGTVLEIGRSGSIIGASANGIDVGFNIEAKIFVGGKVDATGSGNSAISIGKGSYIEILDSGILSVSQGASGVIFGRNASGTNVVAIGGKLIAKGTGSNAILTSGIPTNKQKLILLPQSQVVGPISFGLGADELRVGSDFYTGDRSIRTSGWTLIDGNVDFGGGIDEFVLKSNPGLRFIGTVSNLETLRIQRGNLVFAGQINMPQNNGRVYVHDAGRLTFEIGKSGSTGEMIIGTLRAHQLIFMGDDPKVFVQFAHDLTADDIAKFREQLAPPFKTQILYIPTTNHPTRRNHNNLSFGVQNSV